MSSFYTPPNVRGLDTQIQYNENGVLSASSDLTWDDTAKELGVGGDINLDDGGTYATTLQLITPTANRTISFPDATGTVALVAGSSGQLIYNNAGAYAGAPNSSVGATGNITLNLSGAASTPPVSLTGTWFSGGTSTTTKPQLLIEPNGTTSTAWSTGGTGLGVNAASGFAGRLLDLQINGTSRFAVEGGGSQTVLTFSNSFSRTGLFGCNNDSVVFGSAGNFNTSVLLHNTNNTVVLRANGGDRFIAKSLGSVRVVTALTVATLPASPEVGDIARVTDASAPVVGVTVVGGGAAAALVWYNGTNWTVIGV